MVWSDDASLGAIAVPCRPLVVAMVCLDVLYFSAVVRAELWKRMPISHLQEGD
jgi:hypothetical protein